MLHLIWFIMMAGSSFYAIQTGEVDGVLQAALGGCEDAIALTLRLGAGYLLFCGLLEIAKAAGAARGLEKLMHPLLRWLMPTVSRKETREAVALNLSMNLLGLGNAATPQGLKAVRLLSEEETAAPSVRHDLYMLLILNATGLQLLPTTVLTLRTAAGSANAQAVVLPTLLCTLFSTIVGILPALWLRRRKLR